MIQSFIQKNKFLLAFGLLLGVTISTFFSFYPNQNLSNLKTDSLSPNSSLKKTLYSNPLKCKEITAFQSDNQSGNSAGISVWHNVSNTESGSGTELAFLPSTGNYEKKLVLDTAVPIVVGQTGNIAEQTLTIGCDGVNKEVKTKAVSSPAKALFYVAEDGSAYWCNSQHSYAGIVPEANPCNIKPELALIPDHVWTKSSTWQPDCSPLNRTDRYVNTSDPTWGCPARNTYKKYVYVRGKAYSTSTSLDPNYTGKCTVETSEYSYEEGACPSDRPLCSFAECYPEVYSNNIISLSVQSSDGVIVESGKKGTISPPILTITNNTAKNIEIATDWIFDQKGAVINGEYYTSCITMPNASPGYTLYANEVKKVNLECRSTINGYPVKTGIFPSIIRIRAYDHQNYASYPGIDSSKILPITSIPYNIIVKESGSIGEGYLSSSAIVFVPDGKSYVEYGKPLKAKIKFINTTSIQDTFSIGNNNGCFWDSLDSFTLQPNEATERVMTCVNVVPDPGRINNNYTMNVSLKSKNLQDAQKQHTITRPLEYSFIPPGTAVVSETASGSITLTTTEPSPASNQGVSTPPVASSGGSAGSSSSPAPSSSVSASTASSGSSEVVRSSAESAPLTLSGSLSSAPSSNDNTEDSNQKSEESTQPTLSESTSGISQQKAEKSDSQEQQTEKEFINSEISDEQDELKKFEKYEQITKLLQETEERLQNKVNELSEVIAKQNEELVNRLFEFSEKNQKLIEKTLEVMTRVDEELQNDYIENKVVIMEKIEELDKKIDQELKTALDDLEQKILAYNFIGDEGTLVQNQINKLNKDAAEGKLSESKIEQAVSKINKWIAENQEYKMELSIVPFLDVYDDVWYQEFVTQAKDESIIEGLKTSDGKLIGKFAPDLSVTLAEVLKMALRNAGFDENTYNSRGRVPKNPLARGHWAEKFYLKAEDLGIVLVQNQDPNKAALRGEVIHIMLQASSIKPESIDSLTETAFIEVPLDHPEAEWIETGYSLDIIHGDDNLGTFRPDDTINRAETAKMIMKVAFSF